MPIAAGPALARADAAERDVDADPVEPGRQPRVAAEPLEAAERDHEHLLDEVVEIGAVAEDAVEVAGDLAAEAVIELVVRGALVGAAARDQVGLVGRIRGRRASPSCRASLACSIAWSCELVRRR